MYPVGHILPVLYGENPLTGLFGDRNPPQSNLTLICTKGLREIFLFCFFRGKGHLMCVSYSNDSAVKRKPLQHSVLVGGLVFGYKWFQSGQFTYGRCKGPEVHHVYEDFECIKPHVT